MDNIKSKWEFLLQYRPDARDMIGNAKLIGGHIGRNSNYDRIFNKVRSSPQFGSLNLEDSKEVIL